MCIAVAGPHIADDFLRHRDPGRSQQAFNLLITILTGNAWNQERLFGDSVPLLADKNTLEIRVCGVCLRLCLHTSVCTFHVHGGEKRVVCVLPCVSTYSLETVSH